MKNLNELDLQELTNQELLEVEGGSRLSWVLGFLCHNMFDLAEMSSSCPSNMGK
ncbi:MAG: hypothetical protein ACK5M3_08060 [Dysgonomonas sp.]